MDPRDFQKLATELACDNSPAKMRTAISRAYYAAYHTGVEALVRMGFEIESFGGHGGVRNHLNNSGDDEVKEAITKLGNLHSDRINADYRFYDERINKKIENPKMARSYVEQAMEIIATLDACIDGNPRYSRIIKAIQEYRNKLPAYKQKI